MPPPVAATIGASFSGRRADIGEFDRVERARRGQRGAGAVAHPVEPHLADRQAAGAAPAALRRQGQAPAGAVGRRHRDRPVVRFERLPGDDQAVAFDHGAQIVLFEIGFLHQPIGEPAQQLRLRAAALEAARPEPHLVGQQLRHPALPDAVEHQQRVAAIAAHHGHPVMDTRIDLAEPAPPGRLAARPRRLPGALRSPDAGGRDR